MYSSLHLYIRVNSLKLLLLKLSRRLIGFVGCARNNSANVHSLCKDQPWNSVASLQGSTVQWRCTRCAKVNRAVMYLCKDQPCDCVLVRSTVQWRRTRCARLNGAVVYLCKDQPCNGVLVQSTVQWRRTIYRAMEAYALCKDQPRSGVFVQGSTVQWRRTRCARTNRAMAYSLCGGRACSVALLVQCRTSSARITCAETHTLWKDLPCNSARARAWFHRATAYSQCNDQRCNSVQVVHGLTVRKRTHLDIPTGT